jgi:hypothetical protein
MIHHERISFLKLVAGVFFFFFQFFFKFGLKIVLNHFYYYYYYTLHSIVCQVFLFWLIFKNSKHFGVSCVYNGMCVGRETDPLEDRIRLIRAQNEQIRKRQLEIEADKLQYAWHSPSYAISLQITNLLYIICVK